MAKSVADCHLLYEIAELPEEALAQAYKAACSVLRAGRHADAADAFLCLISLNPTVQEYWIGMGFSEQARGRYQEAVTAYRMASLIDWNCPVVHYYAAKCFYALEDLERAKEALEQAIELTSHDPDQGKLLDMATDAKNFIRRLDEIP